MMETKTDSPCNPDILFNGRKIGPLGTAVFMALALVVVAWLTRKPLAFVITGKVFAYHFDNTRHVGWALDQGTVQKAFILFTAFALLVSPYVAIVRWVSDRTTRLGYWAFAGPTIALCLCLISILTCAFVGLFKYIHAMGFTPMRTCGLAYGLGASIAVVGFVRWAFRKPKENRKA